MAEKPTYGVTFDADNLTADQRDGFACVVCGDDFTAPGGFTDPAVPVGHVDGGQVFMCVRHHDERCTDCGTTRWTWIDTPNDTARALCEQNHPGPTYDLPVRPSVPGTYPDGEPQSVRDAEDEHQGERPADDGGLPDGVVESVRRVARVHGPGAGRVAVRTLRAIGEDRVTGEQALELGALLGFGDWRTVDARLDAVGVAK